LRIFLFTTTSRPVLGPTQPPIQWVPGALSLEVKRSGREADHLSPSNAEGKNAWRYTCTAQYVFMSWCLVKHRDNCIDFINADITSLEIDFFLHVCRMNGEGEEQGQTSSWTHIKTFLY